VAEQAVPAVSLAFIPEPVNAPTLTVGAYLAAVRDLGSPALTLSELQRQPESVRQSSDVVFEHGEELSVAGGPSGSPAGSCRAAPADLTVAPGSTLYLASSRRQPTAIYLRRLASTYPPAPFATVTGQARAMIRFPVDRARQLPWHVRVVARPPVSACVS
jgi:hypothetical protein